MSNRSTVQDVYEAYDTNIDLEGFPTEISHPSRAQQQSRARRRPPPKVLAPFQVPLQKIFDPNTTSSYQNNSWDQYGGTGSDLPLRDDTMQTSIRDTVVNMGRGLDSEPDLETMKPRGGSTNDAHDNIVSHDFRKPALSDPVDLQNNRRTQDWKFPSTVSPASADPETSNFSTSQFGSNPSPERPALFLYSTEPIDGVNGSNLMSTMNSQGRLSMAGSLIDLDMSLPESAPEHSRPSTANSDFDFHAKKQNIQSNPFELESQVSQTDFDFVAQSVPVPAMIDSSLDAEMTGPASDLQIDYAPNTSGAESSVGPSSEYISRDTSSVLESRYTVVSMPELPSPPSVIAMTGKASNAEMLHELSRMTTGLMTQLEAFRDILR